MKSVMYLALMMTVWLFQSMAPVTTAFTVMPFTVMPSSRTLTTTVRPTALVLTIPTTTSSSTRLFFFGSAPNDDGKPGDYACKDCDYVFTKGPKAWSELPDNWSCPVCGAPKRRFTKVPKGSLTGKATKAKGK